jgi:hypothetical protein
MKRLPFKFTPKIVFMVYDLYKKGANDSEVANALNLNVHTFIKRRDKHPGASAAAKYGRRAYRIERNNRAEFDDIILGKLPEELRDTWNRMKKESKNPTGLQPVQHMEMRQKQILWVHAWIKFRFNSNKACCFLQIPPRTVQNWREQESFRKLCEGMMEVKKDFVEDSLLGLIQQRNPLATVFAAKTLLRDRGYGEKTEVVGKIEHSHEHAHHMNIDLTELDLPVDVQMIVMDAIERRKKKLDDAPAPLVIEHKPNGN